MASEKQDVRHPLCDCEESDLDINTGTYAMSQALFMTVNFNMEQLEVCPRQVIMALVMVAVSTTRTHFPENSRQESRDEVTLALDKLLEEVAKAEPWPDEPQETLN